MDKKADAWKNFQDEMKDKRTLKKTPTLRHFLLVFLLVAQGPLWSWWGFFCAGVIEFVILIWSSQ